MELRNGRGLFSIVTKARKVKEVIFWPDTVSVYSEGDWSQCQRRNLALPKSWALGGVPASIEFGVSLVSTVTDDRQECPGRRIFLLSCAKTKKPFRTRAADLYDSALFRKMLQYAERHSPDAVFILSARHRLLRPDDVIDPYEQTLASMPVAEVKAWAERVWDQLRRLTDLERDHFTILASEKYRRYLLPHLRHYSIPMAGLTIGRQLQFLNKEMAP